MTILSSLFSSLYNVRLSAYLLDITIYLVSFRSELELYCMRKNSHGSRNMDEINLNTVNSLEKQKIRLLKYSLKYIRKKCPLFENIITIWVVNHLILILVACCQK